MFFVEITPKSSFFVIPGGSWRPQAENINIPIGILMVWRGPGPPKTRRNMKTPGNSQEFLKFHKIPLNLCKIGAIP